MDNRTAARLSDSEFEALAHRAAERAADILIGRITYVVDTGRRIARTILWFIGAGMAAVGIWHHEPLAKILFGG